MTEVYYFPSTDPPRTPIEVLRSDRSAICQAVSRKNIVIIEDFKKQAEDGNSSGYVCVDTSAVEDGSLICYPVLDAKADLVPYVLTVVADKKKYFVRRKKPIYEWTLKRFAVRIRLEHYLHVLKNKAGAYGTPNKP